MRRVLSGSTGFLALLLVAQPSIAADMPIKAPAYQAPVVAPTFNWTGFYVGVQGGYGWGDLDWTYVTSGEEADHSTSGWLFGGTIGANWQAPGSPWVLGVEADYAWANIDGHAPCPNPAFSCRSELETFGTLRGRLGWAQNNWLFYGTGGLAFGKQRIETHLPGGAVPPSGTPTNGTSKSTSGWTAGLGVETVWAGNWSGKLEWLYYDLGDEDYTVDNLIPIRAEHTGHIVRVGLNYRFATGKSPGPVLSRY